MTTKVYGIHGRSSAILRIPTGSGKAEFRAEFENGLPGAGANYRPATFSTADPIVQRIMETSPHFGRTYVLYRVWHEDDGDKAAPAAKPTRTQIEPLEGIVTKEEAISYLKSKGAKATNLKDEESILKYAEKIGVSFPNLTL